MATPRCTFCEENEGILMASRLDDGTTAVVCPADLLVYALAMSVQYTQGMTVESAESVGELLDQLYANDPRQPKAAGRRRKQPDSVAIATGASGPTVSMPEDNVVTLPSPCAHCGSTEGRGRGARLICGQCGSLIATEDETGA